MERFEKRLGDLLRPLVDPVRDGDVAAVVSICRISNWQGSVSGREAHRDRHSSRLRRGKRP
jgi:hypothetical protein